MNISAESKCDEMMMASPHLTSQTSTDTEGRQMVGVTEHPAAEQHSPGQFLTPHDTRR